ncbi:MAG: sterol desaturase family protein [Hyphomonadaceae bacterium]|nr:sterol desaturase family protein [Hyphomonadaceae bacterium]
MSALALKAAATALWFALVAVWERISPAAREPQTAPRWRRARNGGLWLMNALLNPLLGAPIALWATQTDVWTRPDWASGAAGIALDLIVLDAWMYAWHRCNHESPFLWRFHAIHHRDEWLDATSAVRFHPGEIILAAFARAPVLMLFDITLAAVIVYETLALASAIFQHSNVRLSQGLERSLRRVIVTPSHHWLHHHAQRRAADSNYATILTMWDRAFGTYNAAPRTPSLSIGLEGARDAGLPSLLRAPFAANAGARSA